MYLLGPWFLINNFWENFRFKINGKACTKRISFQENNENVGIVIEGQAANYFTSRHCNLYSVGSLTESFYSLAFPKGKKFDIIEKMSHKLSLKYNVVAN